MYHLVGLPPCESGTVEVTLSLAELPLLVGKGGYTDPHRAGTMIFRLCSYSWLLFTHLVSIMIDVDSDFPRNMLLIIIFTA